MYFFCKYNNFSSFGAGNCVSYSSSEWRKIIWSVAFGKQMSLCKTHQKRGKNAQSVRIGPEIKDLYKRIINNVISYAMHCIAKKNNLLIML